MSPTEPPRRWPGSEAAHRSAAAPGFRQRPGRARRVAASLVAAAALLLAQSACHEPPPRWSELATLDPGAVRLTLGEGPIELAGVAAGRARLVEREGERWVELALERSDWRAAPPTGTWIARVPRLVPLGGEGEGGERLLVGGEPIPPVALDAEGFRGASNAFLRLEDELQLRLTPGAPPPDEARFLVRASHGSLRAGRFRVRGHALSGDGFAVPPGSRVELELPVARGSVLSFATCSEPAVDPSAAPAGEARHRFRVLVDGVEVFAHEEPLDAHGASRWHRLALPGSARSARLSFEVEGPFAHTAFLAPVIGPPSAPAYDAPERAERRPNLVLFVADTLRADALRAYAPEEHPDAPVLAPALEALAGESRVFTHARSVATWTLPAFSSLMTGLFPHQLGATRMDAALPREARMLAEDLQALGYRTVAVTEGGFVSQAHGLAQGFGWFHEGPEDLERTVAAARAAVEADDGRPLFLFVHTFRAHAPYAVSEATRARLGAWLGLGPQDDWERWKDALRPAAEPDPPALAKLFALYRGGVADLDRGVGELRASLDEAGVLANGVLVFTSDHGEAFGEHGESQHTGPPWEVLVRVPLLLCGEGIAPGLDAGPASLLDVAPTLLRLAGGAPEGDGTSLLALDPARAVLAFQCAAPGKPSWLAVVRGERKVLGLRPDARTVSREPLAAFDLGRDPHEANDLAARAAWPRELLRAQGGELAGALEPRFAGVAARIDPLHRAELAALGYLGEDGPLAPAADARPVEAALPRER